ncbi:MCE family protein [Rhodococcus sp. HNM0569]|uniref:MCE family protein n=1 Tax=Rhodococcus sp. HNM0569 TaxID=2716340 RepID=UPI00146AE621|nr:MCE family protein [Rhodococcus sp. HNM0569]NLU82266.1 MCE family protein [Rhodococcus sp. HNM0569]
MRRPAIAARFGELRKRRRLIPVVAAGLVVVVLAAVGYVFVPRIGTHTVTAYFPSTSGLYEGDDVRVLGVPVGRIESISPGDDSVAVRMRVDRGVEVPADAKAVVVAPSLVSGRFVQLTPVYAGGPEMTSGAVIPIERTAVPVEWDEIKTELTKLSDALGPQAEDPKGTLGTFVDTAAENLEGNGNALRDTLRELSDTMKTLSDGRTDLFGTVRNLQAFVEALSSSDQQIVQFEGRLASVSNVLAENSDALDRALGDLDVALGDVQRFVSENQESLTEQVGRLADATQVLADKRPEIERVLHVAPNALSNFNNIYRPLTGSLIGAASLSNFQNPVQFMCGAIQSVEANDSDRSADLCTQYLGPVLNSLTTGYPGIMTNAATGVAARPDQITYQPEGLAESAPPRNGAGSGAGGVLGGAPEVSIPNGLAGLLGGGQ